MHKRHAYLDVDGSRPSPTGAKLTHKFPFSRALAWEKGKRGECGALMLAPMGLRRESGRYDRVMALPRSRLEPSYVWMKLNRSAFIVSASVVGIPCGNPL